MKFEVNVSDRKAFVFLVTGFVLFAVTGVVAYESGVAASVMGHDGEKQM